MNTTKIALNIFNKYAQWGIQGFSREFPIGSTDTFDSNSESNYGKKKVTKEQNPDFSNSVGDNTHKTEKRTFNQAAKHFDANGSGFADINAAIKARKGAEKGSDAYNKAQGAINSAYGVGAQSKTEDNSQTTAGDTTGAEKRTFNQAEKQFDAKGSGFADIKAAIKARKGAEKGSDAYNKAQGAINSAWEKKLSIDKTRLQDGVGAQSKTEDNSQTGTGDTTVAGAGATTGDTAVATTGDTTGDTAVAGAGAGTQKEMPADYKPSQRAQGLMGGGPGKYFGQNMAGKIGAIRQNESTNRGIKTLGNNVGFANPLAGAPKNPLEGFTQQSPNMAQGLAGAKPEALQEQNSSSFGSRNVVDEMRDNKGAFQGGKKGRMFGRIRDKWDARKNTQEAPPEQKPITSKLQNNIKNAENQTKFNVQEWKANLSSAQSGDNNNPGPM